MFNKMKITFLGLMVMLLSATVCSARESSDLTVEESNNLFAFDLYSKFDGGTNNVFFSPYSISTALTMTYEGAKGDTAAQMRDVLHLTDDKKSLRNETSLLMERMNRADKDYQLSTANALWLEQSFDFKKSYLSTIHKYYDAELRNLDFEYNPEESRLDINYWVEDKTEDKIKDLLAPGVIDSDTKLVLTNAVYFKGKWKKQFDKYMTRKRTFKLSNDSSKDVDMMHQSSEFMYTEDSYAQVIELDYTEDLSMLVILPKTSLNEIGYRINPVRLKQWKNSMYEEDVVIALPKFKVEAEFSLGETLIALGMEDAFRPSAADFSIMTGAKDLFISKVIHKAFVEVAEEGTEAAAATAVVMSYGAAPTQSAPPKHFIADHPFVYIIQEKSSGNILFMGKLEDPAN